jgi:hypothetical protein
MRVVFVDDEAANCRLGLRMLLKLGIQRDNVTLLTNGAFSCHGSFLHPHCCGWDSVSVVGECMNHHDACVHRAQLG